MGDTDSTAGTAALGDWCAMWLGSRPVETLFRAGHLSEVHGVVLADGRSVAVKIRPYSSRLQGCAYVQQVLWHAGFPGPEPLVGPVPYHPHRHGDGRHGSDGHDADGHTHGHHGVLARAASAEVLRPGGEILAPTAPGAAADYAALLATLVRLAPPADDVHGLAPAPPWAAWDHPGEGLWPPADDRPEDLNDLPPSDFDWLDDLAATVRRRLRAADDGRPVVGHGDFEAHNIRWSGRTALAVHDWDSVIAAPESVVAGLAAAVWPAGAADRDADVAQTEAFLDAYAAERPIDTEVAWAAGLWVKAFNARKLGLDGIVWLDRAEAAERARRAGLDWAP